MEFIGCLVQSMNNACMTPTLAREGAQKLGLMQQLSNRAEATGHAILNARVLTGYDRRHFQKLLRLTLLADTFPVAPASCSSTAPCHYTHPIDCRTRAWSTRGSLSSTSPPPVTHEAPYDAAKMDV
eukprot:4364453-Amphidinium_carterae.1